MRRRSSGVGGDGITSAGPSRSSFEPRCAGMCRSLRPRWKSASPRRRCCAPHRRPLPVSALSAQPHASGPARPAPQRPSRPRYSPKQPLRPRPSRRRSPRPVTSYSVFAAPRLARQPGRIHFFSCPMLCVHALNPTSIVLRSSLYASRRGKSVRCRSQAACVARVRRDPSSGRYKGRPGCSTHPDG